MLLTELDEACMVRKVPGLFCAGEMLDWEAPTGGYLLTASMASGLIAGRALWHTAPLFETALAGLSVLDKILLQIAAELKVRPAQVNAAVELLDGGATVPFIARYRKEATDGLDDIQLRELEARLAYLRELEERRAAVLKSIDEQGS